MTQQEFDETVGSMHQYAADIVRQKRPDYTQESSDVLANFLTAAHDAGITPLQAWLVHFQKQYSAVARFVKNPTAIPSEPMIGRFGDLRNYIDLGFALMTERRTHEKETNRTDIPAEFSDGSVVTHRTPSPH